MDNFIFELLIILFLAIILVANWRLFKKLQNNQNNDVTNDIFEQQKLFLTKELAEQNSKQSNQYLELKLNLEQLTKENLANQKNEFSNLKIENLENLEKIKNSIQNQLLESINNLIKINKENFDLLNQTNTQKLEQINNDVQKRLDENFARNLKSFEEVNKNLGYMEEKAKQMIESTKSIDKLNTIFARTSSKAFGGFAENYLESLLSENLAKDSWQKQAKINGSSEVIDFVIFIDEHKIGIDAKFPLTKYQDYINSNLEQKEQKRKEFINGVMEMAKSISEKYYKNDYLDALLLYLPSESLYNEVLDNEKNQQVAEFLRKYKVSITSPNTILSQILLIKSYQFKLQISQNAENIVKGLSQIKKNIVGFKEEYRKLGEKIRQAQQNYDLAERNLIGVERNILLLESEKDFKQN